MARNQSPAQLANLRRGGPGRPKGAPNKAASVGKIVSEVLEENEPAVRAALAKRFTSPKTVQDALELTARLTGELKPDGQGGEQPRVAVIIMNGIPEGEWRAIAAQRAQKALDAGRPDSR